MPILINMQDVPESILCELLRSNILLYDETLEIVPVNKWWRFLGLPEKGFIVTNRRVVVYKTGTMSGLLAVDELLLRDLIKFEYDGKINFYSYDGGVRSVIIDLTEQEWRTVSAKLTHMQQI